jgi:hypothetical protein
MPTTIANDQKRSLMAPDHPTPRPGRTRPRSCSARPAAPEDTQSPNSSVTGAKAGGDEAAAGAPALSIAA